MLSAHARRFFVDFLGVERAFFEPDAVLPYSMDWTKPESVKASGVLFPKTVAEVSQILAFCNSEGIHVIPSGGRTGLAGAAVALNGEVILCMKNFNKILRVDSTAMTCKVESGVILQALQEEVAREGLLYPVDLASKGSCMIGGNIATNAGGLKLIRYGGTREQVLGLEVVLADGTVLDLDRSLKKNNSGYDLKQLFIGSEGTLGVITKATLKITSKPKKKQLVCFAMPNFVSITKVLSQCHLLGLSILSFEFFTRQALEKVLTSFSFLRDPFLQEYPFYILVEIEESEAKEMETFVQHCFEANIVGDGVIPSSIEEYRALWSLRENITESLSRFGHVRKNDIALPVDVLPTFVSDLQDLINEAGLPEGFQIILFGHIGDGNIHVNYIARKSIEGVFFRQETRKLELKIFSLLQRYRGSISAEHGIGLLKKNDLAFTCGDLEISYMRGIKKILDPRGILNPGKIFD